MGGSAMDIDRELTSSSNEVRTMVLVGRTGNGKSATGNSILGKKATFKSRSSSSGVTRTCELHKAELRGGQIVNVIDTPGLFDSTASNEFVGKEIVKCIDLAKDGIHAILLVCSVRNRFSQEEEAVVRTLQTLFGNQIVDYMIVVFTGGDDLEENDETLEDFLGRDCPAPLKEILGLCKNRRVLFDNKTKDESKKLSQVQQLLSLVNMVISQNGGKPYTDKLFTEVKHGAMELRNQQTGVDSLKGYTKEEILKLKEEMQQTYADQLKRIAEMLESKLMEATKRFEQQLVEEQAARKDASNSAMLAQNRSEEEIKKLKEELGQANKKLEERDEIKKPRVNESPKPQANTKSGWSCAIL